MTDATNNPNAGQSDDPKNRDGLQEHAREEHTKALKEDTKPPTDENRDQSAGFKPGAPGVPPVGNPD
jgi:hypothetical protein